MAWRNSETQYGLMTRIIHWLVFLLILIMLTVGFFMEDIGNKALQGNVYALHKLTGVFILLLMLWLLSWRFANPKPHFPSETRPWERIAANSVHYLLYLVLIAMPLSGWILATAGGKPPQFFGGIKLALPGIPLSKPLAHQAANIHGILAWVIIVLVSIHALAALKHHFINKDNVLRRMIKSD